VARGCGGAGRDSNGEASRLGDQTFGSFAGSVAGGAAVRGAGRGDNGASSVNSTIGWSGAGCGIETGGMGTDGEGAVTGLDFTRSQSRGPGAGSLTVVGNRGSGTRGSAVCGGSGACCSVTAGDATEGGADTVAARAAGAAAIWAESERTSAPSLRASRIRRNCPSTSAKPIRIMPLANATVPETMSVFPRLKALIGIPNPIATEPTAANMRPTAISTRVIGFRPLTAPAAAT